MSAQALLTAFGDCSLSTEDLRVVEPQELYHFEGGAGAAFCGLGVSTAASRVVRCLALAFYHSPF